MSSKRRRQDRLMRVPTGPEKSYVLAPGEVRVTKKLSEHVALMSDGAICLDVLSLGAPADVYDADFAWMDYRLGSVRMYFAQQGAGDKLYSCLQVKFSPEAFVQHFWENSREFHEGLRARSKARAGLADDERSELHPETWESEKRHAISANFNVLSRAGNEAQIDFFHLPPSGVAIWLRNNDVRGLKVSPKVRILLLTDELFRLFEQCERIVPEVEALVKNREAL